MIEAVLVVDVVLVVDLVLFVDVALVVDVVFKLKEDTIKTHLPEKTGAIAKC